MLEAPLNNPIYELVKAVNDALRRIEQLEYERVVFQGFLALVIKNGIFTADEFDKEISIAKAIADHDKSEYERKKHEQRHPA